MNCICFRKEKNHGELKDLIDKRDSLRYKEKLSLYLH